MIARYNNLSLALGIPGLLLQIGGRFLMGNPENNLIGAGVTILGTVLLLAGLLFYAKAKGRNPAWCLMGFLSIIGLIVLALLEDRAPVGKPNRY